MSTYPNTMDIPNSKGNLPPQLLFVEFHLNNLEGKSLMEQPIDLGTSRQLVGVDLCRARAFDCTFEVRLKLLDHPTEITNCHELNK